MVNVEPGKQGFQRTSLSQAQRASAPPPGSRRAASFTAFKASLAAGDTVEIVNHRLPHLSRTDTVAKAQKDSIAVWYDKPERTRMRREHRGGHLVETPVVDPAERVASWIAWGKAGDAQLNDDGSCTLYSDGELFVTIRKIPT